MQRFLATVVIGGLVSATALTRLLLPLLYDWVSVRAERKLTEAASLPPATLIVLTADIAEQLGCGSRMMTVMQVRVVGGDASEVRDGGHEYAVLPADRRDHVRAGDARHEHACVHAPVRAVPRSRKPSTKNTRLTPYPISPTILTAATLPQCGKALP